MRTFRAIKSLRKRFACTAKVADVKARIPFSRTLSSERNQEVANAGFYVGATGIVTDDDFNLRADLSAKELAVYGYWWNKGWLAHPNQNS